MQSIKYWIEAARLKTIPASFSPVMLGSSMAYSENTFYPMAMFYCFAFALLCQIGTNFSNDYLDYIKGADSDQRIGPRRLVASGMIRPKTMLIVSIITLALAFFVGLNLIPYGGNWLLLIGVLSILFAWCYTGGPYPLAYNALGDIFVILFFGIIAVSISYFVQAQSVTWLVLFNGIACGIYVNNLLIINNIRDYKEDFANNKRTSIVLFGIPFGLKIYLSSLLIIFIAAILNYMRDESLLHFMIIIPLLLSAREMAALKNAKTKDSFSLLLKKTGFYVFLYGIVASLGFILS